CDAVHAADPRVAPTAATTYSRTSHTSPTQARKLDGSATLTAIVDGSTDRILPSQTRPTTTNRRSKGAHHRRRVPVPLNADHSYRGVYRGSGARGRAAACMTGASSQVREAEKVPRVGFEPTLDRV